MFTPDELAEMAAADAEIEATFEITSDDFKLSSQLDRLATREKHPEKKRTCKNTEKEQKKTYYLKNREKILESRKEYRKENKEKIAAYKRAYYLAHKEEFATRSKQWSKNNLEKRRQRNKEDYIRNREKRLEYQRKYYKEHAEQCKKSKRDYYWRKKYGQSTIERDSAPDQRAAAQA